MSSYRTYLIPLRALFHLYAPFSYMYLLSYWSGIGLTYHILMLSTHLEHPGNLCYQEFDRAENLLLSMYTAAHSFLTTISA
ncbi:hypothetical protein VTO73DRAFT_1219 [Trametes versicolor]